MVITNLKCPEYDPRGKYVTYIDDSENGFYAICYTDYKPGKLDDIMDGCYSLDDLVATIKRSPLWEKSSTEYDFDEDYEILDDVIL